jgi:cytochrome P450
MSESTDDDGVDDEGMIQDMYKLLRDFTPVMEFDHEMMSGVSVALHGDIMTVLQNPDVFSSDGAAVIGQVRPLIPLEIDPPEHKKYRRLLDPLFAPRRIAELEPATRALVNGLIDEVIDDGACNFHATVAEPLPSSVFLQMFGLPVERTTEFIELKDGIIRPPVAEGEESRRYRNETGQRIYAVIQEAIDARVDDRGDDFISLFLDAEVDGDRLTNDDILDIGYLFFLAGLDTVTASLDCMLTYLAQHAHQRDRLVNELDVIPRAIEELLRWESPVAGVARLAAKDTELSGCPIAAGNNVSVAIGSANTDERFWDDPNTVDFDRQVNKHLAFGGGVHRCLGSHLARMELRVCLEEWHKRVPSYSLKPGVTPEYTMGLRQVENLELVWGAQ